MKFDWESTAYIFNFFFAVFSFSSYFINLLNKKFCLFCYFNKYKAASIAISPDFENKFNKVSFSL